MTCGHLRMVLARTAVAAFAFLVGGLFVASWSRAHEGHDHDAAPVAQAGAASSPRVAAVSDTYQFVGIAEGEVLVIYLDRAADNEPVTSAQVFVTLDGEQFTADLQKNGTYEVTAPLLKRPAQFEVIVSITEGGTTDLLAGALTIPGGQDRDAATGLRSQIARWTSHLYGATSPQGGSLALLIGLAAGVAAVAGVVGGRVWRKRSTALLLITVFISVPWTASSLAHEGHDHGADMRASSGNSPQRRPDGTIFLPKPSQRLLEVRTAILKEQKLARTVRLAGRVAANPNFSGVVQATVAGRYEAPIGGVPPLGARVKAGDLLGKVAPAFASIDSSDMTQTLGDIEQKLSIARAKLARQEQLLRSNVVAPALVDETRMEVEGLLKRRTDLLAARVRAEELRAPVDGLIAVSKAMSGQVVSPSDKLFEIIDPARVLVEALLFDQTDPDSINEATAVASASAALQLRLLGRSRALQQQYVLIQFEVLGSPASLSIGTPVTVIARTGQPVSGLIVPRAALAQAPNGQTVVFEHKEPELFVPRPVRTEPFDGDSVLVTAGVEAGMKIVVRNALLVNQVR